MNAESIATIGSLIFLFSINLGLGASTTIQDFRIALRNPKAICIGFISQYLFMPISTYILTIVFQLDTKIAIGVILIGCSPGGASSNLFTYWCHGNVSLSITMSLLSTLTSFIMMPLWILLLIKFALIGSDNNDNNDNNVIIAWSNMILTLLMIFIPTMIGLYIREKHSTIRIYNKLLYQWIEILASILGITFLVGTFIIGMFAYYDVFLLLPWSIWILSFVVLPLGCTFGYVVSKYICSGGMTLQDTKAISLETGIQNFGLTIAIIQLSFVNDNDDDDDTTLKYAIMFPIIYGITYILLSPFITIIFRYYLINPTTTTSEEEEEHHQGINDEDEVEQGMIESKGENNEDDKVKEESDSTKRTHELE